MQTSGTEERIDTKKEDMKKLDWLFPETTKNFDKLPLQYRVCVEHFSVSLLRIKEIEFKRVQHILEIVFQ